MSSKIKMCGERQRYTVMAHDDRYAVMTKPFNPKRTYLYTVSDLDRGIRGPINLIFGLSYDVNTTEGAEKLLSELNSGELEVSWRRHKDLTEPEIVQIRSLSI